MKEHVNIPPEGRYFKKMFFKGDYDRYFSGKQSDSIFKIHRSIRGRNSFLPMIKCVITKSDNGSDIMIKMRIHSIILMFGLWILIIGAWGKSTFQNINLSFNLTSVLVFSGFYCLVLFMFKYEAGKDKKVLVDIFNGFTDDN